MKKLMIAAAICVGLLASQSTFAQDGAKKQEPAKKEHAAKNAHKGKGHTAHKTMKDEAKPTTGTKPMKPADTKPASKRAEKK